MRLWIAQGFGVGRIPFAPGTFGSGVGVLWFVLLLASGSLWVIVLGTAAGLAASVWLSGFAERALSQKDPGSVVVDEIAALPICFLPWVAILASRSGQCPSVRELFAGNNWWLVLGVFAGFRFFDILKPWPVRQSQALPGGWGVTVDDLLAAIYVSVAVLVVYGARSFLTR